MPTFSSPARFRPGERNGLEDTVVRVGSPNHITQVTLADDASYDLGRGDVPFGVYLLRRGAETAIFSVAPGAGTALTVTLIVSGPTNSSSAGGWIASDTDARACFYGVAPSAGVPDVLRLRNRVGATATFEITRLL